jgi:hypothetical protein
LLLKNKKKLIGAERKPESRSVACMVAVVKVWAARRPCFVHQSSITQALQRLRFASQIRQNAKLSTGVAFLRSFFLFLRSF